MDSPRPSGPRPDSDLWPTADDAELGVLCVHGIGAQEEGDTLLAAAEPLLHALAGDDGAVTYGETALKPHRLLSAAPAQLSATVARGGSTLRVTLLESWWARAFDPPSYPHMLGWLLSHGTWIAIRHLVFHASAPVRALERKYDRAGRPRPDWLGALDSQWSIWVGLASTFLVAIPLQLLLLATRLLAAIPLRFTQAAAQRIALVVSTILGDASVFTANTAIRQAILSRVRADLERLAHCDKVVVLAHSQGSAVVFDLFRSIADLRRIRLVTYGAGIRKLSELEQYAKHTPWIVRMCVNLWWLGLLAALMAWQTVEASAAAEPARQRIGSLLLPYLVVLLVFFAYWYHAARSCDPQIDALLAKEVRTLLNKGLKWADLYASSDPIPGGPLLGDRPLAAAADGWREDPELSGFRSREVVNRMSAVTDHTTYWETPNDFVPAVAAQIWTWIKAPVPLAGLRPGRKRRVWLRKAAGLLLAAAAVALYVRADRLREAVLLPAWDALPLERSSGLVQFVTRFNLRTALVYIAGLGIYLLLVRLYARSVLDPAWNAWERTVQAHRTLPVAEAGDWRKRLRRRIGSLAPAGRRLTCAALVLVPLSLLLLPAWTGDFSALGSTAVLAGEWGCNLGWLMLLLAVVLGLIGMALQARDRWRHWTGRRS